ncbi:MAG: glycosyltransferase [Candidatus Omnitrophica bacterium]|nr:glycosyltransferase [Candidatus Omnitrophota bacterium]
MSTHSTGITVHCRIKNEERFIRAAIRSVLPLAERVLVYDTGSTDATLHEVASINSEKIEIVQKKFSTPQELCEFRNEMIERTTTEWYMVVDGDEIYPTHAVRRIAEEMELVLPTVHRIAVNRRHFAESFNFLSPTHPVGRIFRTSQIRWRGASGGTETPYLRHDPSVSWNQFSMRLPRDVFFFHCHNFVRSSRDAELGELRRWRRPPFPALPYFGPWPETFELDGVTHWMTPELFWTWIGLNTRILWTGGLTLARKLTRQVIGT